MCKWLQRLSRQNSAYRTSLEPHSYFTFRWHFQQLTSSDRSACLAKEGERERVSGVCMTGLICQREMVQTPCPVANATTEHLDSYTVSVSVYVCVCQNERRTMRCECNNYSFSCHPQVFHSHLHPDCAVGSICRSEECFWLWRHHSNTSSPKACHPLKRGLGGAKDSFKVKPALSGETEERKWG